MAEIIGLVILEESNTALLQTDGKATWVTFKSDTALPEWLKDRLSTLTKQIT